MLAATLSRFAGMSQVTLCKSYAFSSTLVKSDTQILTFEAMGELEGETKESIIVYYLSYTIHFYVTLLCQSINCSTKKH